MSPVTARAVSMALLGGITAATFLSVGLVDWTAFVAWAVFLAAGGDNAAVKKTVPGFVFGAFLAWAAMMLRNQVDIAPGSMLWMPRAGIAAAATLLLMGLSTKVESLAYLPATLAGFAAVFGVLMVSMMELELGQRLTGLHMYNPFIQVSLSMVAGVVVGWLAVKLANKLTKK